MKIVYGDIYLKYHFGLGHPFLSIKRQEFIQLLRRKKFDFELVKPPKAVDKEILLVHTQAYLNRLKSMVTQGGGYLSLDTPVTPDNLEAAYFCVGGTIEASNIALNEGLAINTLGGLHHAGINDSSGFCIFNDHAIAIKKLLSESRIKKAAVLDLDVHAGNGTQEIFYSDPRVFTVSIHQDPGDFYPGTGFSWQIGTGEGAGFNLNYPLPAGTSERDYLPILDEAIQKINKFHPDILFIVLGVDTFKDDTLGGFKLERKSYAKIASKITKLCRGDFRKTKAVILFAGGYSNKVPELWFEFVQNLV